MTQHTFLRIFVFIKPYWKQVILTLFIVIIFATANVYFIPLVRDIADEISKKRDFHITMQLLNAVILWMIRIVTQFGQVYMTQKITTRMMFDIQEVLYEKLHYCSQHFFSNWKLGELLTRLSNDASRVQESIMITFSQLIPQGLTLIGVTVYLFIMNWKLTAIAFTCIPLFIYVISHFSELVKRLAQKAQKKASNITHLIQESLLNMKLIQAYTMEKASIGRLKRENNKNFKILITATRLWETKKALELFVQGVVFFFIILVGGQLVAKGELSGSELLSFFTGCALLIDPVMAFSQGFTRVQESLVSVQRVYDILDYEPRIQNPVKGLKSTIKGHVQISNISFQYDTSNTPVLNDVSIEAKLGKTIALVGLSGAGKTTLINLIPRFYDVTQGSITIDGHDIRKYDLQALRKHIGIVLQDDVLFSGTIMENIRYGTPKASREDVVKAAKAAHCWEFISTMPDKLFTKVGDRGQRLSGGQKQRISIARAILRNPKILILDEATSALDSESEQLVKEALIKLMKGRTTFVIAHRLSTIKHAHTIVVLEKGKIIETGTHNELLKQNSKYKDLYHLQFR